jgi:endonuclease III
MDWMLYLEPLFRQYAGRPHPLAYCSRYELLVMVVLSAQDSDRHINQIAPGLFAAWPTLAALATAAPEDLHPYISSVRNFANKARWLVSLAQMVGDDERIPDSMEALTALPGIGRKSASVIIRESGGKAEGIIVDLHVVRVAPRIGLTAGKRPDAIEKDLMRIIPRSRWNDAGMALSFLGREICRPAQPRCSICVMNTICKYHTGRMPGEKGLFE